VPLDDGGAVASGVAANIGLGPEEYRVVPRNPWRAGSPPERFLTPPLLRGYLRLGSWICGAPAYDPDFGTADFFVLLSLANVDPRYVRHFLGGAG
jgi:putative hemolysin